MFLMQREDIRKTLCQKKEFIPRSKGEEISWRFTCDNNAIKQKWVSYLAQLRDYFLKEKNQIEKYFNQIDNKQETLSKSSCSSSKSGKTPWRESTVLRKQYSNADLKSAVDFSDMDSMFDQSFKKTKQDFRLTNTYAPQVDMSAFGLQCEDLTRTDPGLGKQLGKEMMMKKKMSGVVNGSTKLF